MSNAKHTPGPWGTAEVHANRERGQIGATEIVWLENGTTLATLENYAPSERRANARLMAAAPELMAALEEIAKNDPYNQSSAGAIARAAIANANKASEDVK